MGTKVILYGVIQVRDYIDYDFIDILNDKIKAGYDPVCICCENVNEFGMNIMGIEVISLGEALNKYPELPILATCFCNYDLLYSIIHIVRTFNIPIKRIINYQDVDFIKAIDEPLINIDDYDQSKPLVLYGCGVFIVNYLYEFLKFGIEPSMICDKDTNKHGYKYGIKVCSLQEVFDVYGNNFNIFVSALPTEFIIDFLLEHASVKKEQILNLTNKKIYVGRYLYRLTKVNS